MKTDLLDIRHADCMDLMREFPDGHFDLAVVDPPYGIGADKSQELSNRSGRISNGGKWKKYHQTDWDKVPPPPEYFAELRRVSKHQIVWGGNYYPIILQGVVIWNKGENGTLPHGEMAKTSIPTFKVFNLSRIDAYVNNESDKIHPCQKPVALYRWLLANYAKPGDTILDTHLGSGSIAIACHYAGHHLTACELDSDYYAAACERIDRETRQQTLFPTANKEERYETAALAI